MGIAVIPAPSAASRTMYKTTLTSGTSWTVPAGVTYVNATLIGGGGGGGTVQFSSGNMAYGGVGTGGEIISSIVNTTPGASISYAIGAGGTGASSSSSSGNDGGTTTFTGATSALGGKGGQIGGAGSTTRYLSANNGGQGQSWAGSGANVGCPGGSGCIILEYWV